MKDQKKLAFGLMRLPLLNAEDVTSIDYDATRKMVDQFMEAGFSYYDTAAPYHRQTSEIALRECVAKRYPRDSYTITDKLTLNMIPKAEDMEDFFAGQLARCGVDYFDYYWLHALGKKSYEKAESFDAFAFAARKKAEGKVRHIGFSFHDKASLLDEILTKHPETEYVQLQINYLDWDDPEIEAGKCHEVCLKHGKQIMVMEPVKGGLLAGLPEEAASLLLEANPNMSLASWAIRYAASLENVCMVLSGMSNPEQMADNLSYMTNFRPLDSQEKELLHRVAQIIRSRATISCTACRYCVDGCPMKIAIPEYFRLYNDRNKFGDAYGPRAQAAYANHASAGRGRASQCVKCRKCEASCPQHLPITDYLENVAKVFE